MNYIRKNLEFGTEKLSRRFFSNADVFAAAAVATILLFIRIGLQPDRQWQPVWQKAENFPLIRNP